MFEGKTRSDFERVKQKFDSRHSNKSYNVSSSSKNSSRKERHSSQRLARSSEMSFDECKMNIQENALHFDGETSAGKSGYQSQIQAQSSQEKPKNTIELAQSFNLDGFKVSEDDDDVSSSLIVI